jgi:hypothetical protein
MMPNKMNTIKKTLVIAGLIAISLTTGCATQNAVPVDITEGCDSVNSKQIDAAFSEAKANLSRAECAPYFEANFTALKAVAKGNPGEENKARFAQWLSWSNKQGVITVKQSKALYTRYFHSTFVSLPSQGNLCSHLANGDPVKDMTRELSDKREGYNDIVNDSQGYNAVHQEYDDMKLMLDSVAMACQG